MLSGTTIARAILMLIAAAGAIGLVNAYWTRDDGPSDPPIVAETTDPAPGADASAAKEAAPPPVPVPESTPQPEPAPVVETAPRQDTAPPETSPTPAPTVASNEPKPAPPATANAPAASASLDLNQASAAELKKLGERNKLKNVPAFSKAVIKGRPYASVEELLKRKIVNKAKYDRIRDQVTVR